MDGEVDDDVVEVAICVYTLLSVTVIGAEEAGEAAGAVVSVIVAEAAVLNGSGGGESQVDISSLASPGDAAAAGIETGDTLQSLLYESSSVAATILVVVAVGAIVLLSVSSVAVGVDRVSRGKGPGIDSLKCVTTISSILLRLLNLYIHAYI